MNQSNLPGVVIESLSTHIDHRGQLIELYRVDDMELKLPQMGYVSYTDPGIIRGPHEHSFQSDLFYFIDGEYKLYLWHGDKPEVHRVGKYNKVKVVIPPGIVHGYKNIGLQSAFVLNFPDKLYAGWGKKDVVDEIRHEDDENSIYWIS